jgi:peptidoglycan/LPS O-acetylase OafA/YrhL
LRHYHRKGGAAKALSAAEGGSRHLMSKAYRGIATPPAQGGRFAVLDSWRGVCAVLVALYHVEIIGEIYAGHLDGVPVVDNAYLFVDFFFVLSGFVIAHTYQSRITRPEDVLSFAIRRFGRVWPLHMVVLLAFIAAELAKLLAHAHGIATETAPFSGSFTGPAIVTNIFLVQSFGLHSELTWNQPSWSIGVEFYTYLVFALLVLIWRGRIAAVSALTVITGALIVAACSRNYMRTTFDYGFFRCLEGFFVGVLVHRLYRSGWRVHIAPAIKPTALEFSVVLAVTVFVSAADARPISLLSPLIFGAAVYVFALERGAVSRLLMTRPFRAAGAWSYSIYMTQAFLLILLARIIRLVQAHLGGIAPIEATVEGSRQPLLWFGSDWSADALVLLYLGLLLVTASITYRFVENPGRAFFNAMAARAERRTRARRSAIPRDEGSAATIAREARPDRRVPSSAPRLH